MAYPTKRELSDCGQCIRYLLITGNVFFWMISCVILGVGVWIIVDKNYMSVIYGNILMTVAAYMIVIGGGMLFLITACGCIGAIAQSRALLLIYCCVLVGITIFLFIGAILAIVYRVEIKNEVQYTVMQGSIQEQYGVNFEENPYNEVITTAWDMAQSELRCCGVQDNSWNLYKASEWYQVQPGTENYDKPLVPESCCTKDQYNEYVDKQKCQTWKEGPPGIQSGNRNQAVYYRGCYGAGKEFINDFSAALIGIGVGVSALMIGGILMSFLLFVMIRKY